MVSFSGFDKIVIVFFVLVLGVIFTVAVNVDQSRPFHQFSQVAVGVESVVDSNNVLLAKYGGTSVASCADGNLLKWSSAQNSWVCGGVSVSVTGLPSCSDGQVLKWQSGAWVCGSDNAGSLPSCSNGQVLKYNGTTWICSSDNSGTTLPSCSAGQVVKWNGSFWACAADETVAGTTVFMITQQCTWKRGAAMSKDAVLYCPSSYPILFSCNMVDDSAPETYLETIYSCASDGACTAFNSSRTGLGGENTYLERVMNPDGVRNGCFEYDPNHSHATYRLDIWCCKNG